MFAPPMPNPNAVPSGSATLARSSRYIWLSLPLLLLTYCVLGWFVGLHQFNWVPAILHPIPQVEWWISVVGMILLSAFVTAPLAGVRRRILDLLNVDDLLFMACLGASLVMIFFFIHMDVVIKLIVLTAALLLARFDLVNVRCSGWSSFVVLSLVGTIGLGLGGWGHWATLRYHVAPWADVEKNRFELMLEKPIRSAPTESESRESKPETAQPVESKEAQPIESKSPESKPAESKSAEPKPTVSKPAEPKPAEPKPTEPKPIESKRSK
jgi:hypothetical protein